MSSSSEQLRELKEDINRYFRQASSVEREVMVQWLDGFVAGLNQEPSDAGDPKKSEEPKDSINKPGPDESANRTIEELRMDLLHKLEYALEQERRRWQRSKNDPCSRTTSQSESQEQSTPETNPDCEMIKDIMATVMLWQDEELLIETEKVTTAISLCSDTEEELAEHEEEIAAVEREAEKTRQEFMAKLTELRTKSAKLEEERERADQVKNRQVSDFVAYRRSHDGFEKELQRLALDW